MVATFIDYDYQVIPDSVTITGMVLGLAVGAAAPVVRLEPAEAGSILGGLKIGVVGLLVGGGTIYAVRVLGWLLFRKEAMGFGDVTLTAMIGAFLGWEAVPLVLFLGAIVGLIHGAYRYAQILADRLAGRPSRTSEIPFGPYLSVAALALMLGWRWLWPGWLEELYRIVRARLPLPDRRVVRLIAS